MHPAAKLHSGLPHRPVQLLRQLRLQKALEKPVLQDLAGHGGTAVDALPLPLFRQLRGKALQQLVKFPRADRLEKIVVHVIPDGPLGIRKLAEARQDDDDGLRQRLIDMLRQLQSIHERHADIRDHDVRPQRFQLLQRLLSVLEHMRRGKAKPAPIGVLRHGFADEHFVLHQHDLVHPACLLFVLCCQCTIPASKLQPN